MVVVVAQPDHQRRYVRVVENFKLKAVAAEHDGSGMAGWYDQNSGQLWTRLRHLYLVHDISGCISYLGDHLTKETKDKGHAKLAFDDNMGDLVEFVE